MSSAPQVVDGPAFLGTGSAPQGARPGPLPLAPPALFAVAALSLATGAALLAGWVPIAFSIATVFLFAGPHNWLEARYFLSRMPARWGRLTPFFTLAFAGIFGLTGGWCLYFVAADRGWIGGGDGADQLLSLWNSALLLWIALLVQMRSRQNPRREWGWVWPVCFGLVAVAWLGPHLMSLALVYLHPLMAFWLLDRELGRSRSPWRGAFRLCLACLPLFLGALWWRLADVPPLAERSDLDRQITYHAGAGFSVLDGVSSHLLVATHTFLEMLHYGVWVLAMPLVGLRAAPWRLGTVPMARRSSAWRLGIALFLLAGLGVCFVLWAGFLADYTTTRTVYFTVALMHVLAEVPFLLRAL